MAKKKNAALMGDNRLTSDCVNCEYGKLTQNKKISCRKKNKFMMYGARIVCDSFEENKE